MNATYWIKEIIETLGVCVMIGCAYIAYFSLSEYPTQKRKGYGIAYCIMTIIYGILAMVFSWQNDNWPLPISLFEFLMFLWIVGSVFCMIESKTNNKSNQINSKTEIEQSSAKLHDNESSKKNPKVLKKRIGALFLIVGVVVGSVFLNSRFHFLSTTPSAATDNWDSKTLNSEITEPMVTNNYVLLSTLTESSLFKNMDLMVPEQTVIPSKEEIGNTYSGLYSDTIVASLINTDIIIQDYDIEVTDEINLEDFREQIVYSLKNSRPDISFDTDRTLITDNLEIPVIEFSTEYDNRVTYSFIALVDVNGKFVTIAVNSGNDLSDARHFFDSLLSNMVIK